MARLGVFVAFGGWNIEPDYNFSNFMLLFTNNYKYSRSTDVWSNARARRSLSDTKEKEVWPQNAERFLTLCRFSDLKTHDPFLSKLVGAQKQ